MQTIEELQERLENSEARADEPQSNSDDTIKFSVEHRKLADFMGLDTDKMKDNEDALNFILGWAREKAESEDLIDALFEVKQLRDMEGFQEIGETAVKKLYRYIRLSEEESELLEKAENIRKEKEVLKG